MRPTFLQPQSSRAPRNPPFLSIWPWREVSGSEVPSRDHPESVGGMRAFLLPSCGPPVTHPCSTAGFRSGSLCPHGGGGREPGNSAAPVACHLPRDGAAPCLHISC